MNAWMRGLGSGVLLLPLLLAGNAAAAVVTVTDCTLAGGQVVIVGDTTRTNNAVTDDVVLQCDLQEQAGSDGVRINAHSIVVDGPNGGSIISTGTQGITLRAGMNDVGTACEVPGDYGAFVSISGATLEDQNLNGGIDIKACGDVDIDSVGGSQLNSTGDRVHVVCYETANNPATGQPCQITADHASFFGNVIDLEAEGDVRLICNVFQTIGPRDKHVIRSNQGSVLAGALTIPLPDPACVCPTSCSNRFRGGIESNMTVEADDNIDLDGACVEIAENIDLLAYGNSPPLLAGGVMIDLSGAEVRDDFGKTGFITITAHPISPVTLVDGGEQTGDGVIDINDALIVEHGKQGGGTDKKAVATLNGGDQILVGVTCAAIDPDSSCVGRGIDLNKNTAKADDASRTLRAVINAAAVRCDT